MPDPRPPTMLAGRMFKRQLAARVSAVFNDRSHDKQPVVPQADALFVPGSVIRRVHADVIAMTVGGTAALLLQMLYPLVLAGVWDHSNFRNDMSARLRRTARFIAVTTYGHRHDALEAIGHVRKIHTRITGTLPDGTPYRADDPALLAWVHLTETISFLDAWCRFAEPRMSQIDRDAYVHDMARIGRLLGAEPVPDTEFEGRRQMQRSRVMLTCDMRTDTVRDLLLDQPLSLPGGRATQRLLMQAAIDLLPFWARRLHGIPSSAPGMPAVSAATFGMARTIRWAFRN